MTVAAAAAMVLAVCLVLPTAGTAQALSWKSFTWNTLTSGDCTMFQGATWTLYSDGSASFDATVTSSDNNDAWLMWAHIKDTNNADLATLTNYNIQNRDDWTEFVQNLPDHTQRYRWIARGNFPAGLFPLIQHMTLYNHC